MSRSRICSRLDVMEGRPSAAIRNEVTRVACILGLDAAELLMEAEDLARQFRQHGITTREEQLRFVAEEAGCPVEELERELAAIAEAIA
ncbi:MAG: hypothetical protein QM589_17290 [Thermomicrobiales bacterium]